MHLFIDARFPCAVRFRPCPPFAGSFTGEITVLHCDQRFASPEFDETLYGTFIQRLRFQPQVKRLITVEGDPRDAILQEPRQPLALVRFRLAWRFEGQTAVLASRATDETGYVQPTRAALVAARGTNSIYHYNGIKPWLVNANGTVTNVEA